jgi:L-asparaginase
MRRFLIMAEPITVAAVRGESTESVHRVHAVALRDGQVVEAAGDASLRTFMRSAAKPIQAMPLARERPDLEPRDLAIAAASHLARPDQVEAVEALLAKANATEDDLECGPFEGSKLKHNCSGKHAGMLALCRAAGWEPEGYSDAEHPCQQAMLAEVAEAAGLHADEIGRAVDGCGVTTFAVPLQGMAAAFSRLGEPVSSAMRANPELIRGPGAPDTELMRRPEGWWAKGGAEGVLCAATSHGLALALKVEDGHPRALRPALGAFLERLGLDPAPFAPAELRNSRDDVVGELVAM